MNKLLIGYVVATLLGLVLLVLMDSGLVDRGGLVPSGAGILLFFTLPEMLLFVGAIDSIGDVGTFSFLMSIKMVLGYAIASFILFLWNRK